MTALRRWLKRLFCSDRADTAYYLWALFFGIVLPESLVHPWWKLFLFFCALAFAFRLIHYLDTSGAWGRFVCWLIDSCDFRGPWHPGEIEGHVWRPCRRGCGNRQWTYADRVRADTTPGWQERAEKLMETVRTCKHKPPHDWTREAGLFCCDCGRLLNDDGSER